MAHPEFRQCKNIGNAHVAPDGGCEICGAAQGEACKQMRGLAMPGADRLARGDPALGEQPVPLRKVS